MKRDLRKAEEEEKWIEKTNNRDQWKQITKVAVLRSDQKTSIMPLRTGTRGRTTYEITESSSDSNIIITTIQTRPH